MMKGFHRWRGVALATALLAGNAHAAIVVDLSFVDLQSVEYQRFKGFVDDAVAGNPGYGFSAADAAYMYKLTAQAQYATLAVQTVEAQVAAAEAAIAGGDAPDIAGDQYLEVGPMIEDLALTYDWCAGHVTPAQRTRWGNYAEQAVWNVWHHDQAQWGGHPHAWPGWGVDDPANNYHYSFLRATMYWGLASNSTTWKDLLQNVRWPEQLAYTATIPGGGSEEGTAYGLSHGTLFMLYRVWHDSTGSDIGNANAHVTDSIAWWLHSTVPTRDRVAPIGDQARVSEPVIYDYHRHLVLEARRVSNDATAQANASWWLHTISDQDMESGFNYRHNLLPAGPAGTPPAQLVYHATGTGQLFARTGWDTGAMWLAFSAGPYVQSHAHQDQGAFTLFEGDWLAATENMWTHSGIQQGTDTNNVVRFDHDGATVPQREGTTSTMTVTPGAGGAVHAVADLTPAYDGDAAVGAWHRTIDFAARTLTVTDAFTLGAGTTATFQVNTPVQPVVNGLVATAGPLKIRVISPANATLSTLDWTTQSDENETFNSGWRLDVHGGTTGYMVELSTTDTIFANGFD
ncbi:hypothetical protein FHW12_000167 [Dokdonella fugitiva]|uniref:Heparinase II/III-like protein n=1 Tax=Dokdonella fugitiva TaxID=328517 RepID=A0A839EU81_9GAMM|nr:hypothetical protein [Dokdonella fugitiva]MBA8885976.1 hypothetical protein [Dokdonella fugitiva]